MPGYPSSPDREATRVPRIYFSRIWLTAALLLFCTVPFGWVGLLAPPIWLSLNSIEQSSGWKRAAAYAVTALLMLIAAMGLIPGSGSIELLASYSDASGNKVYASFNPGKAAIAVALLVFMIHRCQWLKRSDIPYIAAAVALPFLCGLALMGPSVKFGATIALAALINLLVVCISEEGFFRWVLQRGGEELLGRWLMVPLVAAIFTLLHTGWAVSPAALGLVAIAGFCYALLWTLRRNLWVCVLAHWGVNMLHVTLLPYPINI